MGKVFEKLKGKIVKLISKVVGKIDCGKKDVTARDYVKRIIKKFMVIKSIISLESIKSVPNHTNIMSLIVLNIPIENNNTKK